MFKPHWTFIAFAVVFAAGLGTLPWMIDSSGQFSSLVPWNFAPVMALGLFAGAYFKNRRWVLFLPLAIMFLRDIGVFCATGNFSTAFYPFLPIVYVAMLSGASLGLWLRKRSSIHPHIGRVLTAGVAAELVFFLISNFGAWIGYNTYPHTPTGLLECYVAAIPFAMRSFSSTLIYSGLIFGAFRVWVDAAQGDAVLSPTNPESLTIDQSVHV